MAITLSWHITTNEEVQVKETTGRYGEVDERGGGGPRMIESPETWMNT